jgi:hypothetical protein
MTSPADQPAPETTWAQLLPPALLALPWARFDLSTAAGAALARAGWRTVGDALAASSSPLPPDLQAAMPELRHALASALRPELVAAAPATDAWPALHAQLFAGLSAADAESFTRFVGIDGPPPSRLQIARELRLPAAQLDAAEQAVRERALAAARPLFDQLRAEARRGLDAGEGALLLEHAAAGSLLHAFAEHAPDRELGLRLLAFAWPEEWSQHRGALLDVPERQLRHLLRALPDVVAPHRLPLHVDWVRDELEAIGPPVPRGALLHLLRASGTVALDPDPQCGDVVVADPRTVEARLAEILQAAGRPLSLADLWFAWREQFRTGSLAGLRRRLRSSEAFVQVAPDAFALRADHRLELAGTAPLADKVARRLVAEGGRRHVADLLPADERDERTVHYVLDHLARDPRVRMLGRGDACAASHNRSAVLEALLADLRRAAGDVVLSRFLANQPPRQRRLVERLLRHNRLFVQPAEDRIDTIANWPFNAERLQRLLALAEHHLQARAGYAHGEALRALVARTDIGGDWLTTPLLLDVLRRHGPFEVLPGGIVAHASAALGSALLRAARAALRDAGVPLSVAEIVRARPELGEFAETLRALLPGHPHVQSADGVRFALA